MTTIAQLATEYQMQPYEVRAALDLGDGPDNAEAPEDAREVLDIMAKHQADRA